MSENKFIKHLKGEDTAKSVLEIKNQRTKTSFANMPEGTSNANDVYSDHRGNATGVLRGADNWKLSGLNTLVDAPTVYGDGRDFIDSFNVGGNGLWVDATYTFATPKIFNPNTKFVLKLCGERLSDTSDTVPFSLVVTVGNLIVTKNFVIREHAFSFAEEFVIDFTESNSAVVKCATGSTMRVQLLCGSADASATLYYGMTTFTALQRRVDSDVVASDTKTFADVVDDVEQLQEDLDDLEEYVDDTFVKLDGSSIMTAPLKFVAGSMRGAVGPYLNGVGLWKLDSQANLTLIATISDSQFIPNTTNAINLGSSTKKWKDLYLAGKAYVSTINNGGDLAVPANTTGTLATKADVDLAANSGRMITDQGVWYAKMYSATVPPAAENGTNYADFSQVDGNNDPIIVIYERQSGAWVQTETITPPAAYDGYVPITSKIWDIAEQAGQQGGRILWNHQSKEFTPYPQIISFEDIEITGESTVIMPLTPGTNQIVNKDYVDTLVSNSIGDATITLTQGGQTMGSFTTNQSGDSTIALDGGSSYHPDLFDWKWADHQLNDVQWLRADTFSWQSGSVYQAAFDELFNDIYTHTTWYVSDQPLVRTYSPTPVVGDPVYYELYPTTQVGTVTAYDDVNNTITVSNGYTYAYNSNQYVTPTTETVAGITVTYYPGTSGRKIVPTAYMSAVESVYTATGVAWYYIIDVPNKQFKLPRTKHNKYTETLGVVGNGRNTVYTNGSYDCVFNPYFGASNNGIFVDRKAANIGVAVGTAMGTATNITEHTAIGLNTDPTKTNVLTTPIPQDTDQYKYLYFYVGEFTQTAIENTAGLNAELFNDKVDVGHEVIAFQAPTAGNNYTWYRLYADGWVEQGGRVIDNTQRTSSSIVLPIEMNDAYYTISATPLSTSTDLRAGHISTGSITTTGFAYGWLNGSNAVTFDMCWQVSGMAAQGA